MMRIYEFTGVLDPNTWKNPQPPDGSSESWVNQWDVQKAVVEQCRRFGIKGHTKPDGSLKQPGRKTIARFIADRFPAETPDLFRLGYRLAQVHVIDKWIRGIEFAPDEGAYSQDDVPRRWKSYLARLSMISEFWWNRPLTPKEAEVAQYVGNEFQDLLGKQVDLIPQLVVVRTIASAEQSNDADHLRKFELYFACAPWESSPDLYADKIEGLEGAIVLPDFMLVMDRKQGWKDVSPVFEDALRQLGVPYSGFWFDMGDWAVRNISTSPHFGGALNGACDWKAILKTRTTGENKETSPSLDTDEALSAELTKFPALVAWLKKEKWKQIERVNEEKTND